MAFWRQVKCYFLFETFVNISETHISQSCGSLGAVGRGEELLLGGGCGGGGGAARGVSGEPVVGVVLEEHFGGGEAVAEPAHTPEAGCDHTHGGEEHGEEGTGGEHHTQHYVFHFYPVVAALTHSS